MAFPLWPDRFRHNSGTVVAAFLNKINREIEDAIDAAGGGAYSPANVLHILGAGLTAYLNNITLTGVLSWGTQARDQQRIKRVTVTTGDVTVRDVSTDLFDHLIVDGSGQDAPHAVVVDVDNAITGEILFITLDPPHASNALDINSEGKSANPLITLNTSGGFDPEWVALWFDGTRTTGGNADGEWAVLAHGAT